jgi:3-methyladenine DNA glycosylase AlkD
VTPPVPGSRSATCGRPHGAGFREERVAALRLARHRRARPWLTPETLPLWRDLVVTGAWWDLVDEIATHPLRDTLLAHPGDVAPVIRAWATEQDLWLRRAAVLSQVGARAALDQELLIHVVQANLDDPSFWLRKAIGWALRDHARTDPAWVWAQVERWGPRLSPLSRREATKHRPQSN